MSIQKVTLSITVEVTDDNVAPTLVSRCLEQLKSGSPKGELFMRDGETVKWVTKSKLVEPLEPLEL